MHYNLRTMVSHNNHSVLYHYLPLRLHSQRSLLLLLLLLPLLLAPQVATVLELAAQGLAVAAGAQA
jgi:hypothetical protein